MPALKSGYYELTWEKCAQLPSSMYGGSAVLHKENIYVMAGNAPQNDTYYYVFSYNININEWSRLPPPGHYHGVLQILNDKLTVFGGRDDATNKATNKVSTFNNNSSNWSSHFPNMLQPKGKPGVVTHEDHVIVLGGAIDDKLTSLDDIEVLNLTQPFQWMKSNIKLPQPMWRISLTISHDQLYIVGYSTSGSRYSTAYHILVDPIMSSIAQPPTNGQSVDWNKLPDAPHYHTALLPHSYPPVIIGGDDIQGVPTSDVAIFDIMKNKWNRLASLSTARSYVAVVPISHDSILVIGGTKGGIGVEANKASCVNTVEKGTVSVSHTVATMPTQDSTCSIQ